MNNDLRKQVPANLIIVVKDSITQLDFNSIKKEVEYILNKAELLEIKNE